MSSTDPESQLQRRPCVLMIDDDPSVRGSLSKLLEESGYGVRTAADGRSGLRLLQREQFHLLVLDLDLPGISGWDLLDFAGSHWPLMPVLVLTGFSSQCVPGSLYGADALLEKPPDVARLLDIIATLLSETAEARLHRRGKGPLGPGAPAAVTGAPFKFPF